MHSVPDPFSEAAATKATPVDLLGAVMKISLLPRTGNTEKPWKNTAMNHSTNGLVRWRSLDFVQRLILLPVLLLWLSSAALAEEPAAPSVITPGSLTVKDRPWDNGNSLIVTIALDEPTFTAAVAVESTGHVSLSQSEEFGGLYVPVGSFPPDDGYWIVDQEQRTLTRTISGLFPGRPYYFRVHWLSEAGDSQLIAQTTEAASPVRQWFVGEKWMLALVGVLVCGAVIGFIEMARRGMPLKVRKIAGLEAVDEAVGRATEMGRSVMFIPGIQDMNEIQTIAGLNILSHVARVSAEYDARVEVPTSRALVMTAARETLQGSFLAAGRPEAYTPDMAYYVTDEQFGYVAYVSGTMVREKPAACFYLGSFFAESLILAETGNSVGAIQVAGTAQPSQLPFFVAACDYTLIGEELFAASAYLSGSPEELGSLKGQDVGKILVAVSMIVGCLWVTWKTLSTASCQASSCPMGRAASLVRA